VGALVGGSTTDAVGAGGAFGAGCAVLAPVLAAGVLGLGASDWAATKWELVAPVATAIAMNNKREAEGLYRDDKFPPWAGVRALMSRSAPSFMP
jgi:hypothetical protein